VKVGESADGFCIQEQCQHALDVAGWGQSKSVSNKGLDRQMADKERSEDRRMTG